MSAAILKWLAGHDTGLSSKAIAICALGGEPEDNRAYPHDGADFGRCYRLLTLAPEARAGLEALGRGPSPYWQALVARWTDITAAYEAEMAGERGRTYNLMRGILAPLETASQGVVNLGHGVSVRFGGAE